MTCPERPAACARTYTDHSAQNRRGRSSSEWKAQTSKLGMDIDRFASATRNLEVGHVDPRDRSDSDIGLKTGCKIVPLASDWSSPMLRRARPPSRFRQESAAQEPAVGRVMHHPDALP
jgi:hypothetical protein